MANPALSARVLNEDSAHGFGGGGKEMRAVLPRLLMGAVAFVQLMSAELGVSILAFGRSIEEFFAAYWSAQGVIGLAAQIAFAVIPMIQRTEK